MATSPSAELTTDRTTMDLIQDTGFVGVVRRDGTYLPVRVVVEMSGRVHGYVETPVEPEPTPGMLDLMDREPASDFE